MKDLIKKLVEVYGPSGRENKVREIIKSEVSSYADDIKVDRMGNLIVHKKGDGKKVMIAAHMDEIGIVVSYIDKKGFLRFSPVGGIFPDYILAERIQFENGIIGVIGMEKKEKDEEPLNLDKMYIDIGAGSKEEAEKLVSIGSIGCYKREFQDNGNRIIAKSLDDRIGCVVLIEALKRIKDTPNDLYFVFTVQEEVGTRGAKTSAFGVSPDAALAVDVTATGDTPEAIKMAVELGRGAAVKVKDWGTITDQRIKNALITLSKEKNIPYQLEVLKGGATDAMAIQGTKEGVPSGAISIPSRYIHSPSEIVDINDVNACIELSASFLQTDINRWEL